MLWSGQYIPIVIASKHVREDALWKSCAVVLLNTM